MFLILIYRSYWDNSNSAGTIKSVLETLFWEQLKRDDYMSLMFAETVKQDISKTEKNCAMLISKKASKDIPLSIKNKINLKKYNNLINIMANL